MSNSITATKLAQDLDAALAAFQRFHGRAATIERLRLMLERSEAAQRVLDDANERAGNSIPRAAE